MVRGGIGNLKALGTCWGFESAKRSARASRKHRSLKGFQAACFSRVPLRRQWCHASTRSNWRKRDRDSNTGFSLGEWADELAPDRWLAENPRRTQPAHGVGGMTDLA